MVNNGGLLKGLIFQPRDTILLCVSFLLYMVTIEKFCMDIYMQGQSQKVYLGELRNSVRNFKILMLKKPF